MSFAWHLPTALIVLTLVADVLIGDPAWIPHPVRLIGLMIEFGEKRLWSGNSRRDLCGGAAVAAAVVLAAVAAVSIVIAAGSLLAPAFAAGLGVIAAWTTIALRGLDAAATSVQSALAREDLCAARAAMPALVGRDPRSLDREGIIRATVESVAENSSDGVIAPLFYLFVGGPAAAMAYKAINTLDSMIGHREPPFTYFGRFVARLDDLANFLPARIAAASIALAAPLAGEHGPAWRVWREEGSHHASPNAGQVEAAMAGALDVRLGGTNYYDGNPVQGHVFNACGAVADRKRARAAIRVVVIASGLVFAATFSACLWNDLRKKEKQQDA